MRWRGETHGILLQGRQADKNRSRRLGWAAPTIARQRAARTVNRLKREDAQRQFCKLRLQASQRIADVGVQPSPQAVVVHRQARMSTAREPWQLLSARAL